MSQLLHTVEHVVAATLLLLDELIQCVLDMVLHITEHLTTYFQVDIGESISQFKQIFFIHFLCFVKVFHIETSLYQLEYGSCLTSNSDM